MSNTTDTKFEWTDELVKEYGREFGYAGEPNIEEFKINHTKQPKQVEERIKANITFIGDSKKEIMIFLSKEVEYRNFPASKIGEYIESVLNKDTVVDDSSGLKTGIMSQMDMYNMGYKDGVKYAQFIKPEQPTNDNAFVEDQLTAFVNLLRGVKWDNDFFVHFVWGITPVVGRITLLPYTKQLQIMPCKNTDDIGSGNGQSVIINFPRNDLKQSKQSVPPIVKDKEVLFTTEDGVEITEWMDYWYVEPHNDYKCHGATVSPKSKAEYFYNSGLIKFSTKEAAEQYILENKPCLSVLELFSCYDGTHYKQPILRDSSLYIKLIEKVKQKLKQ